MIPRAVYTTLEIIACPQHLSTGHAMIHGGVSTPLGINAFPLD